MGFLLLSLGILGMKGGMALKIYQDQDSIKKAFNAVVLVSTYLCVVFLVIGLSIKLLSWLSVFLNSEYWKRSHWFWESLVLLIIFSLSGIGLWKKNLISWEMLQDIKTIPIVSPVLCFGAPALWSKNIAYASLDSSLIETYSTLLILTGVIFLLYLVVFGLLNHKLSNQIQSNEPIILDANGNLFPTDKKNRTIATSVCFCLFCLGLYIFLVVLVDVLVQLSTLTVHP